MTESRLQTNIKKALESEGCFVVKTDPPPKGLPDLLVVYSPGKHFWLEVKTAKGILSPPQKAFHRFIKDNHDETVYVVRSKTEALEILSLHTPERCSEVDSQAS